MKTEKTKKKDKTKVTKIKKTVLLFLVLVFGLAFFPTASARETTAQTSKDEPIAHIINFDDPIANAVHKGPHGVELRNVADSVSIILGLTALSKTKKSGQPEFPTGLLLLERGTFTNEFSKDHSNAETRNSLGGITDTPYYSAGAMGSKMLHNTGFNDNLNGGGTIGATPPPSQKNARAIR